MVLGGLSFGLLVMAGVVLRLDSVPVNKFVGG